MQTTSNVEGKGKTQKAASNKKRESKIDEKRASGAGKDITKGKKNSQRTSKSDLSAVNDMKKTTASAFNEAKKK